MLTARESIFVALVSTELAYKEVAELMSVEENGGASVTELYTDMGDMVHQDGDKNHLQLG